jgi:hypothetical protein
MIVASFAERPTIIAKFATQCGLEQLLPAALWRKVNPPPRRAELVRIP